ncbi:hypothetical protein T484DRAFT_1806685 [Baffinella frigidus]|nr:hypothetical protein T484DRAFT_1806685 [Cryptophyta sp. CCMP2293]
MDVQALAGLDVDKAEKYAEMLPAMDTSLDIDVQELEKFTRAAPKREQEEDQEAAQVQGGDVVKKDKKGVKARSRKKEKAVVTTEDGRTVSVEAYHLPKKYVDLVEMGSWGKPDPERWLPWHHRSYNRKLLKKRKGAGTASGGAQAQLAAGQGESPQASPEKEPSGGSNKKKGKKGRR